MVDKALFSQSEACWVSKCYLNKTDSWGLDKEKQIEM